MIRRTFSAATGLRSLLPVLPEMMLVYPYSVKEPDVGNGRHPRNILGAGYGGLASRPKSVTINSHSGYGRAPECCRCYWITCEKFHYGIYVAGILTRPLAPSSSYEKAMLATRLCFERS